MLKLDLMDGIYSVDFIKMDKYIMKRCIRMKKIIFSFIIAFMISLPYASAERLLDIGAELFYQRFLECDRKENINCSYTELKHAPNYQGSGKDLYAFLMRTSNREPIMIMFNINTEGYIEIITIMGQPSYAKDDIAIALGMVEKIMGVSGTEAEAFGDQIQKYQRSHNYNSFDNHFAEGKVWINKLNRYVTETVTWRSDGSIMVLFYT